VAAMADSSHVAAMADCCNTKCNEPASYVKCNNFLGWPKFQVMHTKNESKCVTSCADVLEDYRPTA